MVLIKLTVIIYFKMSFRDGLNASNHSIIYINFATSTALAMEQTTLYSWYELVGNSENNPLPFNKY